MHHGHSAATALHSRQGCSCSSPQSPATSPGWVTMSPWLLLKGPSVQGPGWAGTAPEGVLHSEALPRTRPGVSLVLTPRTEGPGKNKVSVAMTISSCHQGSLKHSMTLPKSWGYRSNNFLDTCSEMSWVQAGWGAEITADKVPKSPYVEGLRTSDSMLLSALPLSIPASHQSRRFSTRRHGGSSPLNSCSRGTRRDDNTTPLLNFTHTSTLFPHSECRQDTVASQHLQYSLANSWKKIPPEPDHTGTTPAWKQEAS